MAQSLEIGPFHSRPGHCAGFYLERAMTDQQHLDAEMERDIQALELTAPRVTPEQIDALMRGVRYEVQVVPGTTTTLATAIAANGFTLAIGMTACADPANFNAEFGAKYAIKGCRSQGPPRAVEAGRLAAQVPFSESLAIDGNPCPRCAGFLCPAPAGRFYRAFPAWAAIPPTENPRGQPWIRTSTT